jgi:hypothetical protein
MLEQAKVSLSSFELQLVTDPSWILSKNVVIQKVISLFSGLSDSFRSSAEAQPLPSPILKWPPKISRGENYQGLPYVMLDYPRCFTKEHVCAVRTFFWWGHYFSSTLHLKGRFKTDYEGVLGSQIRQLSTDAWINFKNDEWCHIVSDAEMRPLNEETLADVKKLDVLKLAYKLDLTRWDDSEQFLLEHFHQMVGLLAVNSQDGETIP